MNTKSPSALVFLVSMVFTALAFTLLSLNSASHAKMATQGSAPNQPLKQNVLLDSLPVSTEFVASDIQLPKTSTAQAQSQFNSTTSVERDDLIAIHSLQ
jgi:hypothetical protein